MAAARSSHRLVSDYKPDLGMRRPNIDFRAMDILWPVSTGCGLDPAMRLVALLLLVWDQEEHRGKMEWDHDQIADRTGLSVSQVARALDRLRQVHLVRETAAGPRLTFEEWDRTTKPQWLRDAVLRPPRPSGSPAPTPTRGQADGQADVAQEEVGEG